MARMGNLSFLRLVLPIAVLAASAASVQAGSTQAAAPAPAPVRAVVAPVVVRPAPAMQAPRPGAPAANNFQGGRVNAAAPNAVPTFSPTFQTGGQTTPMISGSSVAAPPQQAGRFNFVPITNSSSPANPQTLPAQNSAPPPARVTFSAQPTIQPVIPPPSGSSSPRFTANSNGTVTVTQPNGTQNFMSPQQAAAQYGYQIPNAPVSTSQQPVSLTPPSMTSAPLPPSGSSGIANSTPAIMPSQTQLRPQPSSGSTSSGYTFSTNASGMVQTFQNGQLISTGTAQSAAQYGYKASGVIPTPNMSVAGPTTPMAPSVQQPTRTSAVPTSQLGTSAPQYMGKGAPVPSSVTTQGLTTLPSGQQISSGVLAAAQNTSALDATSKVNPSNVYNGGYFYAPGTSPSLQKECVAVVGALRPDIGSNTNNWSQGSPVVQPKPGGGWIADPALVPGTPIATFKNGSYPGKTGTMDNSPSCTAANVSSCAHAAIFEGYTYDNKGNIAGMKILEQSDLFSARVGERAFSTMQYPYSVVDNFSKFSSQ
jgi:hypothetical protein